MHPPLLALSGISFAEDSLRLRAETLAARLHLPVIENAAGAPGLVLRVSLAGLELLDPRPGAPGAVRVDFRQYPRRGLSIRGEAVARAVGLRAGEALQVVDATAGLARDAFVLASLGAKVRLIERSPALAALLEDGIARAAADPELAPVAARLELLATDALDLLPALSPRPDVVYIDPMYPEAGTKGQVKKEMQLLRALLGPDPDVEPLFRAALACASRRVVVKRPRRVPPLPGPRPNYSLEGRSTRFDVYLGVGMDRVSSDS